MSKRIIDHIDLDGRFMRSVALDRDLEDPRALETYLITGSSLSAVQQIGQTLADGRAQRAWKVIGPYGSGKSALGLLIAHLLEGPKHHRKIFEQLSQVSPSTEALFNPGRNLLPVAVVGSRSAVADALARQLLKHVEVWDETKQITTWKKKLDLEAKKYGGHALTAVIPDVLKDFITLAQARGYSGVVLLLDELGKFVEQAALYPEDGDLMALQRLAELACRPDDDSLLIITMLHQHFGDYARGIGRSLEEEWHKVAARFEEIAFDEPIERYAQFAGHALGASQTLISNGDLRSQAKRFYKIADEMSILNLHEARDLAIESNPQSLYPLHPLVIASMAVIAKRYGQSERSFHAFLRSHEPFGLRDYASRTDISPKNWLTLPAVFDFLASGHGLRFRDLAMERRWAFGCAIVGRAESENATEVAVFKCAAVLELVSPTLRVKLTPSLFRYALECNLSADEVNGALTNLVEKGLLLYRKQRDEYVLAVSDAVNIEAVFDSTAQRAEGELLLHGIQDLVGKNSVIASRHYDSTGAIRTMSVNVGTVDVWPSPPEITDGQKSDGVFSIVLIDQQSATQRSLAIRKIESADDPLALHAVLPLSPDATQALITYSRWCLALEQVTQKSIDPWTSKYVEARMIEAREEVERVVMSALIPDAGRSAPGFYHHGSFVAGSGSMNLSRAASWLFDTVFPDCPRVINELINKDAPASAIVLARQRLFELVLAGKSAEPLFKAEEFPPERLLVWSLLRQTGMLIDDEQGGWRIQEPSAGAALDITHVWRRIGELLSDEERPSFASVLQALSAPPLGLKEGTAGVWVAMYLITRRRSCAIFERNSFVLEITNEHLARMFRNPSHFEMREIDLGNANERLLHDYRNALGSVGYEPKGALSYVEIARAIMRWAGRLPEYAQQTTSLSADAKLVRTTLKRATDPVELLMNELPENFKRSKSKHKSFEHWLSTCLTEISLSHRKLQDDVARALSESFALPGPLKQVRAHLQQECAEAASEVAEASLKSFTLRCADLTLTDERWLDSVASLIVQRPLDAWADETLPKFKEALAELCAHYRRWIRLIRQTGKSKRAGERFLAVTMTLPGGEETSVFLPSNDQARRKASSLIESTLVEAGGDMQMALAILAQALTALHSQSTSTAKKGSNERQTG